METSSEHTEAAAILMDVSQQPQQEHSVYSNQSQAATILMDVGQAKSGTAVLDIKQENTKPEDLEASTVLMAVDGGGQESFSIQDTSMQKGKTDPTQQIYTLSESAATTTISPQAKQQFKVMSSDGEYHTITLTGVEEKMTEAGDIQTSSIIQVETPGRETETITVSGLADNYNLETLSQIAEIVVNSTDRANVVSLTEESALPQVETGGTSYSEVDQGSQYIAMKEADAKSVVGVPVVEDGDRRVVQTIAVDSPQGSQNLVSLAQIAELVINQGCLEVGDGQGPTELQIASDSNNQPILISNLDSNIGDIQTVTSTPKILPQVTNASQPGKTEYITVPLAKNQQQTTKYITMPLRSSQKAVSILSEAQSSYTTTLLPDGRQHPPQRSSTGKNIYSKIKAENGECYMVVLPESDPLNPAQLRNLLSSYNMSEVKTLAGAKADSTDQRPKPQMYSAGSQTTRKCKPLPKPYTGTRHERIPGTSIVIVGPASSNETSSESIKAQMAKTASQVLNSETETAPEVITQATSTNTQTDIQIVKETEPNTDAGIDATNDQTVVQMQIKTEVSDEGNTVSGTATEEDEGQSENQDNCGHEVAKKKADTDQPRPESKTISIQTDVTANCYLNISPEELNIHKRRHPRMNYVNKRIYLDDPKPSTVSPSDSEPKGSPFLRRKNLIDVENAFYLCGTCGAKYVTAEELKTHSKAHKPKKAFCPTCKKKCGNLKILADHVISHTRCKTFKCCVCSIDTIFKSAEAFKDHVKEHLDDRYFLCGSCNQRFIHVANLKVHMRVHTGEKPFKCNKCPVGFSQKASLEAHVSSFHNNQKPFQCDQCGVSFARKTDLKIHARKHSGERPYECDHCSKTFSSNSGLTSHKKTHFRKRFHQCHECEKSFDTPARLKKHRLTWHSGDKAMRCRYCEKPFLTRESLRAHTKTHTHQPYPCVNCSFGTSNKDYLAAHIKEMHPELIFKMPELFEMDEIFTATDKDDDIPENEGTIPLPKMIEIQW